MQSSLKLILMKRINIYLSSTLEICFGSLYQNGSYWSKRCRSSCICLMNSLILMFGWSLSQATCSSALSACWWWPALITFTLIPIWCWYGWVGEKNKWNRSKDKLVFHHPCKIPKGYKYHHPRSLARDIRLGNSPLQGIHQRDTSLYEKDKTSQETRLVFKRPYVSRLTSMRHIQW